MPGADPVIRAAQEVLKFRIVGEKGILVKPIIPPNLTACVSRADRLRSSLRFGSFYILATQNQRMHLPPPAFPKSLWEATAISQPPGTPLEGAFRANVAVMGGGFTGLSAALYLAERGATARVLEAHDAGWGTSGRAGGQVIAGYHRDPDVLRDTYGDDLGERMAQFAGDAPNLTFALIARHNIDCHAQQSGWIQAMPKKAELKVLYRRADMWAARGVEVAHLDSEGIAELLGTREYAGGWLDKRGGTVQPMSYARGLARAASAAGAVLHWRTAVERLRREGRLWRCETRSGAVIAENVLICTNAYIGALQSRLRHTIMTAHSIQAATAPLSEADRALVLPGRQGCADTRVLLRYFRLDPDGVRGRSGDPEAIAAGASPR